MAKQAIKVDIDNTLFRNGTNYPQRQDIPEVDKTPNWYWQNLIYYLTFYNQPIGALRFDANPTNSSNAVSLSNRVYPVQHMIKMMMYYLGKQPNLDYAWLTQDVKDTNMQAQWYKGQDVAKFVNHFKGLMMERIANANWSADSISKETQNRYTDMYDKMEVAVLMKPILDQLEQQSGIGFNPLPNAPMPEVPEDIERSLATNFYEESSEIASTLAQSTWFQNHWHQKSLKSFVDTTISGTTGWWHRVENGKQIQNVVQPYQLIWDNRFDDDYGAMDEFRGVVESLGVFEATSRYRQNLTSGQIQDLYDMSKDSELTRAYANSTVSNVNWWGYSPNNQLNTCTVVTMYWRTQRTSRKVKGKNKDGIESIRKPVGTPDEKLLVTQDIAFATVIGNKYLVDWGYIDNLVESVEDPGKPEFPIFRFRPNTFLGDSVSEVSRIYRLQDEIDMLNYKIRDMLGKAKGKVHIINGDKLGEGTTVKQLIDDFADMGFHVSVGVSGIADDPADRKNVVDLVDMTLDPNIQRYIELVQIHENKMGAVLSTSNISLGQQTRYVGNGQVQSQLTQGQLGIAYLLDGFLDFLVMNMRYSVNQAKNLYASNTNKEVEFYLGDKGVRYLKFTKGIQFEKFNISLTLNDLIDSEGRASLNQLSLAWAQNGVLDVTSFLKLQKSRTYTQALDELDYDVQAKRKQDQKAAAANMQAEQAHEEMLRLHDAGIVQLKEDNENWRTQFEAIAKQNLQMLTMLQSLQPPASPLQQNLAQVDQQQSQPQQQ